MANLERAYTLRWQANLDEQLFEYRGRARLTQCIPWKTGKYGIQVWWIRDYILTYPLEGIVFFFIYNQLLVNIVPILLCLIMKLFALTNHSGEVFCEIQVLFD